MDKWAGQATHSLLPGSWPNETSLQCVEKSIFFIGEVENSSSRICIFSLIPQQLQIDSLHLTTILNNVVNEVKLFNINKRFRVEHEWKSLKQPRSQPSRVCALCKVWCCLTSSETTTSSINEQSNIIFIKFYTIWDRAGSSRAEVKSGRNWCC